jgi:hypothetical protein
VRDRGHLDHALDQARETTAQLPGRDGLVAAAAQLAHGIAEAQAFDDGNHRTAHLACQTFLHNNGLGYLSPLGFDDDELAEHLAGGLIKSQPDPPRYRREDTLELFRQRLANGGPVAPSGGLLVDLAAPDGGREPQGDVET